MTTTPSECTVRLRRVTADDVPARTLDPVDPVTRETVAAIVDDVRTRGLAAMREHAERLGDLEPGAPWRVDAAGCRAACDRLPADVVALLERTAARIRRFADAQRASLGPVRVDVPGGWAGHRIAAVDGAGCYAPGGRFPLPSSMLMTVCTARAAGVPTVWAASPRPDDVTLAAAAIAGADGVLAVGGAQAIAALAYGVDDVPGADVVCGPGNRWVTAAKQRIAADRRIDMLAGPSELLLVVDETSDPATAASDLIAQAEHDTDAIPMLVAPSEDVVQAIEHCLDRQLSDLPTAETARAAFENGWVVVEPDRARWADVCDRIAPEHLQLSNADASELAERLRHFGGLFVGGDAAEVLGDYGAGPNHTLPTGGTARRNGGLSVMDFIRWTTELVIERPDEARALAADAEALARLEGLVGHARAAARRTRPVR